MRYTLHLSRHVDSFGKPVVGSEPAAMVGHVDAGKLVKPDMAAVRAALPHYYRKAFDRAGSFWFENLRADAPARLELRSARDRPLNQIAAFPRP